MAKGLEDARQETPLERYSATVAILGDGVAVLDADGVVQSLNPAGETVLGVAALHIVGRALLGVPWETINDDGTPRPRDQHPALIALRTGRPQYDVHVGLLRQDGAVSWIAVTAVPLEPADDGTGSPIGVVVSFRDVSLRKAAEAALARSQHTLDIIFNATNDFIFLVSVEYRADGSPRYVFEAVNAAYCRITDRPERELVGRALDDALPRDRAERARAVLGEAIANGEAVQKGPIHLANETIIVESTVRVIEKSGGRPSRILGVGRDVTRQARGEALLRASEQRFRTMAESMGEGLAITDLADNVLYVNDRIEAMTGYTRDEIIGKNLSEMVLTPESQREVTRRMQDRIAGASGRYLAEVIRKDGERRWFEVGGAPYRDASGQVIGTVGVMTDVTDRKTVDELREQLVGVVSHELRTPLGALSGALKLLAREIPRDDASRATRLLDVASRNADRLLRLVNDLLDLERLESTTTLQIADVAVSRLFDQVRELLGPIADEAGVRVVIGEVNGHVHADAERIMQVLVNLTGNAIKFSPKGGTVSLTAEYRPGEIEFQIRDEGRGIPADRLPTLFRRFSQVHSDDARKKKGSGLGLAISRTIVEQHGGRIWAESPSAGGAMFRFTLPVAHATNT